MDFNHVPLLPQPSNRDCDRETLTPSLGGVTGRTGSDRLEAASPNTSSHAHFISFQFILQKGASSSSHIRRAAPRRAQVLKRHVEDDRNDSHAGGHLGTSWGPEAS